MPAPADCNYRPSPKPLAPLQPEGIQDNQNYPVIVWQPQPQPVITAQQLGQVIVPITLRHETRIEGLEQRESRRDPILVQLAQRVNEQAAEIRQLRRNPCVRLGGLCNLM